MFELINSQAPDTLNQIVRFAFISNVILSIFLFIVLIICIYYLFKEYEDNEMECAAKLASGIVGVLVIVFLFISVGTCIKTKYFPKAYLVEKIFSKDS